MLNSFLKKIEKIFTFFSTTQSDALPKQKFDLDNFPEIEYIEDIEAESVIGLKIVDLHYSAENLGGLNYFAVFLTLENGIIISPHLSSIDSVVSVKLPDYAVPADFQSDIIGQRILNFHNNPKRDISPFFSDFIELSNKIYIAEISITQSGLQQPDLYTFTAAEFLNKMNKQN
jgi:hypothetical protein